jgi:hypothetical protein
MSDTLDDGLYALGKKELERTHERLQSDRERLQRQVYAAIDSYKEDHERYTGLRAFIISTVSIQNPAVDKLTATGFLSTTLRLAVCCLP